MRFILFAIAFKSLELWASGNVIYHAFDQSYREIESKLEEYHKLGVRYIQISPPQKSRNTVPYTAIDRNVMRKCLDNKIRPCPKQKQKEIAEKESVKWNEIVDSNGKRVYEKKPWYLHYQPVSYEIDDTYGNEKDLTKLINMAKNYHPPIEIIVDAVLVHFRASDMLEKKDWTAYREQCSFKPQIKDECNGTGVYTQLIPHLSKILEIGNVSLSTISDCVYPWKKGHDVGGWPSSSLPALRLDNPLVRKKQKEYLLKLMDLGVRGFRFDVARQIPEENYTWLNNLIKERKKNENIFLYGEVIENNPEILSEWKQKRNNIGVTAYHIFGPLKEMFAHGGNFENSEEFRKKVSPNDITFVATHDTIEGGLDDYYVMSDFKQKDRITTDSILSQQFLIGAQIGNPLLLKELMDKTEIQEALTYNQLMKGTKSKKIQVDWYDQYDKSHFQTYVMAYQNDDNGFFAINKHGEKEIDWQIVLNKANLKEGCYHRVDLPEDKVCFKKNDQEGSIHKYKITGTKKLAPRTGAFYVLEKDSKE